MTSPPFKRSFVKISIFVNFYLRQKWTKNMEKKRESGREERNEVIEKKRNSQNIFNKY